MPRKILIDDSYEPMKEHFNKEFLRMTDSIRALEGTDYSERMIIEGSLRLVLNQYFLITGLTPDDSGNLSSLMVELFFSSDEYNHLDEIFNYRIYKTMMLTFSRSIFTPLPKHFLKYYPTYKTDYKLLPKVFKQFQKRYNYQHGLYTHFILKGRNFYEFGRLPSSQKREMELKDVPKVSPEYILIHLSQGRFIGEIFNIFKVSVKSYYATKKIGDECLYNNGECKNKHQNDNEEENKEEQENNGKKLCIK